MNRTQKISLTLVITFSLGLLVILVPVGIAPKASIPTQWFPFLLILAVFCQAFAQSIATLI